MHNKPTPKASPAAAAAAVVMVVLCAAAAAVGFSPAASAAGQGPATRLVADVTDATASRDAAGTDLAQSRNAARSRMRECGHQWSAMKKSGSASGMTWKDFSQGCLAKQ